MATVQFVFFLIEGTTTAANRRVVDFREDDENWSPVPTDVGGTGATFPSSDTIPIDFVRVASIPAVDPTATGTQSPDWRVNVPLAPSPSAITNTPADLRDLATRRALVLGDIDGLILEAVETTQGLNAKITVETQADWEAYIAALEAMRVTVAASANPEAVAYPAAPAKVAATTSQAEVLKRAFNSGNFLDNSDFQEGAAAGRPAGWVRSLGSSSGTAGPQTVIVRRVPGETYAGANFCTLSMHQQGSGADGYADCLARALEVDGGESVFVMPCEPGQRVEFSGNFSLHRCEGSLYIEFFDAAGVSLGTNSDDPVPNRFINLPNYVGPAGSSVNPDLWPRYVVFGIAPAGAAFANVRIRKRFTQSGNDSYLFLHAPLIGHAHERQTAPSRYQRASSRFLTGVRLRALSVLRAVLANGAVSDELSASAAGPFAHTQALVQRAKVDLGALAVGDLWFIAASCRIRQTATSKPFVFIAYRYFDPDTAAFSDYIRVDPSGVVGETDFPVSTTYNSRALWGIVCIPSTDVEVAFFQGGTTAASATNVLQTVELRAQRVTK